MDLRRLRLGELLAAVGAVVLVVSLFLDWVHGPIAQANYVLRGYGAVVYSKDVYDGAASGLEAGGIVLVVLLLAVAALAATLVVLTVTVEPVGLTMASAVGTAFFGIVMTIATTLRVLLFQPDLGIGLGDSDVQMQLGAYLSLAGVFLCAAGGWITMRDERQSAPYSAAPTLEPRPAPPAT